MTGFFRNRDAWERRGAELPAVIGECGGTELRAWVAGCASSEEAYNLAILLDKHLDGSRKPKQIFATDLSALALQRARQGCYSAHDLEYVSPARIERYFRKHQDYFRIDAALRETVTFAQHDLLHDAPFSRMDIVTCRNLLIYFKPEAHTRVLRHLHFALNRGDLLMLGRSEAIGPYIAQFEAISKIVSVNPAFLRLPDIENRTIEGLSLDALAVDDAWIYRRISDLVKLVRRKRRPLHDHEIQVNGVSLMLNADVMGDDGVVEQVLVALEDVTVHHDFKQASMDRAAEQQAQSLRKDEWVALLGHERRNPLGALSTAVSLLSAGIDSVNRNVNRS